MKAFIKFALLTLAIAHTAITEVPEEEDDDFMTEAQSIIACKRCGCR